MLSRKIFFTAFSTALLSGFGTQTFAQDIIKTKSGKSIEAKILEVSDEAIRFKKFSNQEGPTVVIKLAKVASVTYENGEVEEFDEEEEVAVKPRSARSRSVDRSYVVQEETEEEKPVVRTGAWENMKSFGFGVWIDPAGFMQWGPMAGVHMRFGSKLLIDLHFRMSSLGIAYRAVSDTPDELFGPGFGFSSQRIFPVSAGYWHLGGMFDLGYANALYDKNERYETEEAWYTFYVTAYGGFTFQFKNGFFLDLSLGIGTLYLSEQDARYSDPSNYYYSPYYDRSYDADVWFFGIFQAKLGYEF